MEETQIDFAGKIIRTSIHTFLKHFNFFSTIPILLLIPFSSSLLLSQSLFHDSGFLSYPKSLLAFLFHLPFASFSFLIAKSYIIQSLNHHHHNYKPSFPPPFLTIKPLLSTHLCSLLLLIAITATTFFILLNPLKPFYVTLYCFLANAFFVTNMALVVAGIDGFSSYEAIQKAFLIRRSKGFVAFMLFLPTHMGIASVQALFWYRVVRVWSFSRGMISGSLVFEGLFVAYLYSLLIVLDTIVCCFFYKSCELTSTGSESGGVLSDTEIVREIKHGDEEEFP